jgi:APA family basic amino acid/polyamine antiporter
VPALFILAAAVLLVFSIVDQPRNSLIGTGIILLGIPLYRVFERRNQRQNLLVHRGSP